MLPLIFAVGCIAPAFVVSCIATAAMRVIAPRWNLVDQPADRKTHSHPTPLGGGIAIWAGTVVPLVFATLAAFFLTRTSQLPEWLPDDLALHLDGVVARSSQLWAVLAGATLLCIVGLIDDARNLPWLPRLIVQLAVAAAMVSAGVGATVFSPLPWLGSAVTLAWIVVLVNSFNFLDNMDGLSAGIGCITSVMFAAIMLTSLSEPRWLVAGVLLVLAGSLAGFLVHNWPPATIFMGDSGSYFIGLMLATMTVLGTFYESDQSGRHVMLAPLCILAIPLYDFCSVLVIRLRQGKSPFHADRNHFSHRLVELGLKPRDAVLTIHLATMTTGIGGLLLYRVSGWTESVLVLVLIGCILAIISILETAGRRSKKRS